MNELFALDAHEAATGFLSIFYRTEFMLHGVHWSTVEHRNNALRRSDGFTLPGGSPTDEFGEGVERFIRILSACVLIGESPEDYAAPNIVGRLIFRKRPI